MILDIHLERCDDKSERFRKIAELNKPFLISVVPVLFLPEHEAYKRGIYPADYYYPAEIIDFLKQAAQNPNVVFGQQGLVHYCPACYKVREEHDPWHENYCLYGHNKSLEEQISLMKKGKQVIEDIVGVQPIIYIPPNHQFDENTKKAARELGYKYFTDRNIVGIRCYEDNGLIVVPESDIKQKGQVVYTHYDEIAKQEEAYFDVIRGSIPLESLRVSERPALVSFNEKLKLTRKKLRDLVKISAD